MKTLAEKALPVVAIAAVVAFYLVFAFAAQRPLETHETADPILTAADAVRDLEVSCAIFWKLSVVDVTIRNRSKRADYGVSDVALTFFAKDGGKVGQSSVALLARIPRDETKVFQNVHLAPSTATDVRCSVAGAVPLKQADPVEVRSPRLVFP